MGSDHQLEFRTQSVSILCLGSSGLCLSPTFLVSFPAMPLQTRYDPITLLPPTTGAVWPTTLLHSMGVSYGLWTPLWYHHPPSHWHFYIHAFVPEAQTVFPVPVLAHVLPALQGPSPLLSPTGGRLGLLHSEAMVSSFKPLLLFSGSGFLAPLNCLLGKNHCLVSGSCHCTYLCSTNT